MIDRRVVLVFLIVGTNLLKKKESVLLNGHLALAYQLMKFAFVEKEIICP